MVYNVDFEICTAIFLGLLIIISSTRIKVEGYQSWIYRAYLYLTFFNCILNALTTYALPYYDSISPIFNWGANMAFLSIQMVLPVIFIVSVGIGVILTLPISSAAVCASLVLVGRAGGAAVAGCCAQMIGFAVISFRENRWGGLISQGIGTSMLQMGNIVKNPRIWIAPTLASAITGPIATCIFHLEMNGAPISSGMGTCGLVGQIGVYTGWANDVAAGAKDAITAFDWVGLILISFILPAILAFIINEGLRKIGWVKDGDMKLAE